MFSGRKFQAIFHKTSFRPLIANLWTKSRDKLSFFANHFGIFAV